MTTRWKITIEYDGAGFAGWQKQGHAITVQEVLETAIKAFSGEEATLHVAGRTDAGVHALAQVAHFDIEKTFDPAEICGALSFHVRPHRIVVTKAEIASPDFHARFSATRRRYLYRIVNRRAPLALERGRAWHIARPLSLAPMQEASALLIGHHDFSTFRAKNCQARSPLRTLDVLKVAQEADVFEFGVAARSFLYHQVRNMVGTLALVGTGQWSVQDLGDAFAAADRARGGPTAPADGLYFIGPEYGGDAQGT